MYAFRFIKIFISIFLLGFVVQSAKAQDPVVSDDESSSSKKVVIRGLVTDDKKSPVELANVRVEGTLYGAVCDLKGKYSFSCESVDSVVVVFFDDWLSNSQTSAEKPARHSYAQRDDSKFGR